MGWEWSRLNNICELIEDCPHSTAPDEGEGYPLIRTPNVGYGKLELKDVHRVCKAVYLKRNVRATPVTHDLIFAREAPAGNIAVIEDGEQVCLGQRTVLVRPFKEHLNPYYLAYYILSPISQQILVNSSTGTTVAHVNLSDFRPYLIAIPPYKEQLKIVEMINSVIPVVNQYGNMRYRIDILNDTINIRLKKSILQEAIQGKLIPQDPNDEPASILLQRIKEEKHKLVKEGYLKKKDLVDSVIFKGDDNKYYEQIGKKCLDITDEIPFDIPENWKWIKLDQGISLLSGRDLEPSQYNDLHHGIPYITGASNFVNSNIIINRWTEAPITISNKGDLLLTCKGTIGSMAFNDIGQIHIARQVMAITSYGIDLKYIKCFLQSNLSVLEKNANSMIPGISRSTLLGMLFPLPPFKEQQRIVAQIEKLFEQLH